MPRHLTARGLARLMMGVVCQLAVSRNYEKNSHCLIYILRFCATSSALLRQPIAPRYTAVTGRQHLDISDDYLCSLSMVSLHRFQKGLDDHFVDLSGVSPSFVVR